LLGIDQQGTQGHQMTKQEKEMVTDHIVEIRHGAIGKFLDLRGSVADYVRSNRFLPHWKIESNVISFRDSEGKVEKEGAFAGYKSFGYFTYNPPTKSFFQDRAIAFIKLISKNQYYRISGITRFGCRSKVFVPSDGDFESINRILNENFLSGNLGEIVGNRETDLQLVIEYKEKAFDGRLVLGPMHKDEMKTQVSFESEHFSKVGLFIDIDYFIVGDMDVSKLQSTLKEGISLTWDKVDGITRKLGI
jgi:hypothetical protein